MKLATYKWMMQINKGFKIGERGLRSQIQLYCISGEGVIFAQQHHSLYESVVLDWWCTECKVHRELITTDPVSYVIHVWWLAVSLCQLVIISSKWQNSCAIKKAKRVYIYPENEWMSCLTDHTGLLDKEFKA